MTLDYEQLRRRRSVDCEFTRASTQATSSVVRFCKLLDMRCSGRRDSGSFISVKSFTARLELVPHGGQYVVVPAELAEAEGLRHAARVRGTVNGAAYRSSLMKYSGIFHLGLHKAALAEAGVKSGARVKIRIELDDEPLPTDSVPQDLARALKRNPPAGAAWKVLRPSAKREHVKSVVEAKKPETRSRRIEKVIVSLTTGRG
jgi:hypothetical protein